MTSELNNNQQSNQQPNQQPNQSTQDTPYYHTQEYQDKMFQFMRETQAQNFKKDRTSALHHIKSRNARYSPSLQFSPENVQMWMQNPMFNESRLRDFSSFLYDTNALYRWVITTLANMPTWSWMLSMDTGNKSPEKNDKMYRQGLKYIHDKNIKYEMQKAFLIAIKQDFFYGYEVTGDNYYFVLNLDPNFCRVNRQVGDGIYGFQFNFSYFTAKLNVEEDYPVINSYPPEFRRKYREYLDGRHESQWIDLDIDNTICLKMNDDVLYGLPYYANLFPLLVDLGFYKDLARERAEIDNFLLLHQKIPLDEKEFNKFAIDLNLAKSFDTIADGSLPDGVRMFTSPMDVTAVKTERSSNDKNNVKDALSQVYTGAGIPQALSNADTNTSSGIARAITVNEQIVYRFYRQVEKVYNYKLKNKFISTRFQFELQNITNFNKKEETDMRLRLAQNGISDPIAVASASGVSPYEFMNRVNMEYDVLGITHKLRPIQTSHTMSGNDVEAHSGGVGNEGGAPVKSDGDLSDEGEKSRENGVNVVVE